MKNTMFLSKCVIVSMLSIGVMSAATMLSPSSAMAVNNNSSGAPAVTANSSACGNSSFLGFPAWYRGLTKANGESCDIMSPSEAGGATKFVWILVLNIVEMILRAAGYAAVLFIIYGGYKYMISVGSPDGMVGARKTIMNAVIGLAISIAAVAIVNTISGALKI